jgi:serine/threonine protein kinase
MKKMYSNLTTFQKDYQYDLSDKESILGEGSYGVVVEAYDHDNNKKVALKIGKDLMHEFNAAKNLSHRNIAKYESCYSIIDSSVGLKDYAIMQLYPEGNLSELLKKVKLNPTQLKDISRGILEGLQYLHSNNRIHRDFKPTNILVTKLPNGSYRPLIADFGLTKVIGENDYIENTTVELSDGRGTASYKPPEQIVGENARYNLDLWAFGVILYEMILGERPFKMGENGSENSRMKILFDQIKSVQIPEQINSIQEPYQSIIRRCLVKDINERVRKEEELLDLLDEIPQILAKAKSSFDNEEHDNSKSFYESVLNLRQNNEEALQGLEKIKNLIPNTMSSIISLLEDEAKRFFNLGKWDLAMAKYVDILAKDNKNKIAQQGIKDCLTEIEKNEGGEKKTDDKISENGKESKYSFRSKDRVRLRSKVDVAQSPTLPIILKWGIAVAVFIGLLFLFKSLFVNDKDICDNLPYVAQKEITINCGGKTYNLLKGDSLVIVNDVVRHIQNLNTHERQSITDNEQNRNDDFYVIKRRGEVKIGVQSDASPLNYIDNGRRKGLDYDLAKLIFSQSEFGLTNSMAIDADHQVEDYEEIPKMLSSKNSRGEYEIDIVMGGLTFNDGDDPNVVYTIPYLDNFGYCLVSKKNDNEMVPKNGTLFCIINARNGKSQRS